MLPNSGIQKSESLRIIRLRFALVYIGTLAVFFVPFSWSLVFLTIATFVVRFFGVEAGAHRYFAHRAFKTSRTFQLILACLSASSGQRGPIWWATYHRLHHKYADTPSDPHSPVQGGRFYAYVGWALQPQHCDTDLDIARDLSRFPELVWVNKYHYLFPVLVLVLVFCLGQYTTTLGTEVNGISAVVWGYFLSTFLAFQVPFLVNTFTHGTKPWIFSYRTYETSDTTTNNWPLCIFTMGASWHNNHHRYMSSARTGFFWWEIDLTYWMIKVLQRCGIVWDLREVPKEVLDEGRKALRSPRNAALPS